MKRFLLLPFLLPLLIEAQPVKDHLPSAVATFLGGLSDGVRDGTMFRNDGAGQWWNGKQSWLNKYKDRNPYAGPAYFGSTSFLVFTTDAPHFFNMLTHQFNSFAVVLSPGTAKMKLGKKILYALGYNAVRQAGHSLAYYTFFKKK